MTSLAAALRVAALLALLCALPHAFAQSPAPSAAGPAINAATTASAVPVGKEKEAAAAAAKVGIMRIFTAGGVCGRNGRGRAAPGHPGAPGPHRPAHAARQATDAVPPGPEYSVNAGAFSWPQWCMCVRRSTLPSTSVNAAMALPFVLAGLQHKQAQLSNGESLSLYRAIARRRRPRASPTSRRSRAPRSASSPSRLSCSRPPGPTSSGLTICTSAATARTSPSPTFYGIFLCTADSGEVRVTNTTFQGDGGIMRGVGTESGCRSYFSGAHY